MATPNELNLVTDPYLFLICGPLGTWAGNQLENNLVTFQKENYLYLFIQVELISPSDDSASIKTPVMSPRLRRNTASARASPPKHTTRAARGIRAPGSTHISPKPCLARSPRLAHVDKHTPTPLLGWFNILCWYPLLIFFCALSLC